jgi:hypothetical protein
MWEELMTPKADFYAGVGIAVFAAIFFVLAGTYPVAKGDGLGPGGFPRIVTGGMFLLGILLSLNSFVAIRKGTEEEHRMSRKDFFRMLVLGGSFLLYITTIKYLGYIITTPFFIFLFMYLYGDRKWKRMFVVSIAGAAVTFALFKYVFMIYLPEFYFL